MIAEDPRPLNVVGVGASAGGVEALKSFTAELPPTLPSAILVVLHMPAAAPSVLSRILDRHSTLPAINALFRSIALTHGPRATGVLSSGVLDDGLLGLAAIRSRGGTAIAQSPNDALFPAMPQNAIDAGLVDHQAPAAEIATSVLGSRLAAIYHRQDASPG